MTLACMSVLILGCYALRHQLFILHKVTTKMLLQLSTNRSIISHKVESMVKITLDVHRSKETCKEGHKKDKSLAHSLLKFVKKSDLAKIEKSGGIIWCAKKICSEELFQNEGIAVPTWVLAGNFSMTFT